MTDLNADTLINARNTVLKSTGRCPNRLAVVRSVYDKLEPAMKTLKRWAVYIYEENGDITRITT